MPGSMLGVRKRRAPKKYGGNFKRHKGWSGRSMRPRAPKTVLQTGKLQYMRCRDVQIMNVGVPSGQAHPKRYIRIPIAWQRKADTVGQDQSVYYDTSANPYGAALRFAQCRPNWKQFAIKGLKIEYVPRSNQPTAAEIGTVGMSTLSGLQNLNESIVKNLSPSLMSEPGFKLLNPRRRYSKYISCKKISKQQHLDWVDAVNFVPGLSTYQNGPLSGAWTMLIWELSKDTELLETLLLGTLRLTWYITFRGQES